MRSRSIVAFTLIMIVAVAWAPGSVAAGHALVVASQHTTYDGAEYPETLTNMSVENAGSTSADVVLDGGAGVVAEYEESVPANFDQVNAPSNMQGSYAAHHATGGSSTDNAAAFSSTLTNSDTITVLAQVDSSVGDSEGQIYLPLSNASAGDANTHWGPAPSFDANGNFSVNAVDTNTPYSPDTVYRFEYSNINYTDYTFDITIIRVSDGTVLYTGNHGFRNDVDNLQYLDAYHDSTENGVYVDNVTRNFQPTDSGTYISANHSASELEQGFVDLSLNNVSADITWEAYTSGSWSSVNSTTVTTDGNHTLDVSGTTADTWRVNVSYTVTGDTPSLRIHGDGVQFYSSASAGSNFAPADGTKLSSSDVEFSMDVTDRDFGLPQSDQVEATLYLDGSQVYSETVSSNQTVSTTQTLSEGGDHTYHWELNDSYGESTTTATKTVAVPAELRIYNESAPTELVSNATVEIRMYANESGSVQVFERNTTDGTINMSGLPADQGFVVVAEADGYYNRRIYVPSLYETQSIYLLNNSVQVSDTIFAIDDYTGDFPSEHTVLLVQRALNGSYESVLGDFFGGTDEFPAQLAHGERHRLVLYNTETGERRVAGTFTPLSSSTQTVVVTPQGVSRVDGLPPTVSMLPQFQRLPALDGAEVSVAVRDGESMVVESWNVTARLVNDTQNTVVWSYSQSGAGSQAKTLNLAGHHNATLQLSVTWNTTGGLSATKTYDISLTKTYGGNGGLLGALSSLAGLSPEGNARAAFTAFLAMLVTVFIVGATASILPSQTIPPLVGVLTLTGFSVISWVSYDVVFVAAVGFLAFTAIRRGI